MIEDTEMKTPNQQITKKQHHFPQMMLKRFLDDTNKIFMLDAQTGKINHQTTETVAYQNHLYTVHYAHGKDDGLEKKFSAIESRAEDVLGRFLGSSNHDIEDCKFVLEFAVILMIRTPKIVGIAENISKTEHMKETLLKRGSEKQISKEEIESYISDLHENKGFSYAATFSHSIADRLKLITENFDAVVHTCSSDNVSFVVSDNYAVFEPLENLQIEEGKNDWYNLPVHIHCPLAYNKCLCFTPKPNKNDKAAFNWSFAEVSEDHVNRVNQLAFRQKERYLYSASIDQIKALQKI